MRWRPARSIPLLALLLLDAPCGPQAQEQAPVCALAASAAPVPALHGRARVSVTVRDGAGRPLSGARASLRVEGGAGVLVEPPALTGADGVATATLGSEQGGEVVVSGSAAIGDGSVPCGRLSVSFSDASFPVVQPGLVRWLR
jgi:hypothetical protein